MPRTLYQDTGPGVSKTNHDEGTVALGSGTKLGPYEIVSAAGAGGMGEVYRARDTRLDRSVAIKILPEQFSQNPDLKQRFEREARTISSLNHPNICTLYDVGHQDNFDYLVMEFVEGETLSQRLAKGPLPIEQVLRTGYEVADALDRAHRSGIVHRDLKPGNIMLTKSGAKLLDFGLAKPAGAMRTAFSLTGIAVTEASPVSPITQQGQIVGTFQYMSPEQIEGKEADPRSDIFSLGAVLHEIATGKHAFEGKTTASVIAAVLEREPPRISELQPMSPPALDHVVRTCLAKNPDERWQTAGDVKLELKWISESKLQGAWPAGISAQDVRQGGRRALLWATVSVLVAAITGMAGWMLKPMPPQPVSRTVITLPPGQRLAGLEEPAVALSDDGKELAYVARQGDSQQIYLRSLDNPQPRPIPGTEGGINPFFSPDGQWLGFFADQKLKKVALSGEAVVTLGDVVSPHGASWSSQGTIAFADTQVSPVLKVPEAGGTPQPLTHFEPGEVSHRGPEFLPGDKALLFVAARSSFNWSNAQIVVQSLSTGERRDLIKGAFPRYAPSGHLLYAQSGNLLAVPFDARRLAITGTATPVVEGVLQSTTTGAAQYSISSTGSLVYVAGGLLADQRRLVWVSRAGKEQPVEAPVRAYLFPRLSPDGKHIAVGIAEEGTDIWSYDLARDTLTRLTFGGIQNLNAVWSPDGTRIAFQSQKEGPSKIYWQPSDGTGQPERLTTSQYANVPMSWSPDGQVLAFIEVNAETGYDLWVLSLKDRKARPFLRTPFNESAPRFSPDGRWLAYISNESGRYEIYVQPFPGPGAKLQISTDGGTEPVWNPRGRELFYRNGNKMMVVGVAATKTTLTAGKPRILFEGQYLPSPATTPNYEVSSDGQQFLMIKAGGTGEVAPTQINVVLNWFEELKRRVPPNK